MKIEVYRQACCAADDQVGTLEAQYQVESESSFSSLIQQIVKSGFLQFTSTHDRMTGEINGKAVVEVFSPYGEATKQPVYVESPNSKVNQILVEHSLSFYFRHV